LREKELRIALVCSGGVSLAVYMHGMTKEILKLVRASSALHGVADRSARAQASFLDRPGSKDDPEFDTESVYFDLLRDIGRFLELRVVVDVIAGASAGGINGTMLARALSHDLPMGSLRDLWLRNADIAVLLAPDARAGSWSKWFIKPLLWAAVATGLLQAGKDSEVRQKLSLLVRSRWFKPPLDGPLMTALMYDAVTSMGAERAGASLLPSGHSLDLFVTLTDYYGYRQLVQIHDPPLIHELEHHHVLRFSYRRRPTGEVASDFGLDNAPGLAFAARATSSFPGAFPPAQILEMDDLLAQRQAVWPRREEFVAREFEQHLQAGVDPITASFIDGAVLNNRPFQIAISAIHGRSAYRQVDRRLVYIEPHPASPVTAANLNIPGFFSTLRGAMSDIPSSQPVTDELSWVIAFNDRVRRLRAIIDSARPHVSELVTRVVTASFERPIAPHELRAWREQVNSQVALDAGFAYQAYVRLKLASVREFGAQLIVKLRGVPAQSPLARVVAEIIDAWALAKGIVYERVDSTALEFESATAEHFPAWVNYLLAFDVKYRERRLHFMIEGQNRLYGLLDQERFHGLNPQVVDRLKREFYRRLDGLRRRGDPANYSQEVRDIIAEIFPTAPSASEIKNLHGYATAFVEQHVDRIDRLIAKLSAEIDLNATTRDLDDLLAGLNPDDWHPEARREVLINYLGFPFWDVLALPVTSGREMGELNEILVDRISPQDVHTLNGFQGIESLRGIGFGHFAAFFSRAYRENDYLLGRLHAADRLIEIVCDSAGMDAIEGVSKIAFKKRAFSKILDSEESYLRQSKALIEALRRCIAGIAD
jgi:patatin-related protein